MTEENVEVPTVETPPEVAPEKKRRGRGGNRNPRKPSLKDWVRVCKSQGNGLDNQTVHLIMNEATGLCELVTQAKVQEGSDELEKPRTQVFKITSFELINDPNRNPLAVEEKEEEKAEDSTENAQQE